MRWSLNRKNGRLCIQSRDAIKKSDQEEGWLSVRRGSAEGPFPHASDD